MVISSVTGESPDSLVKQLNEIKDKQVLAIVPYGNRHVAYLIDDVRKSNQQNPKEVKNGKRNS